MNKNWGGICLISSTAIGSGILALPIILANFSIVGSFVLLVAVWLLTYYTSLVSIELSLQAKKGLSIGELARLYSGKGAEILGKSSIKIISYALLSVFIHGLATIIQKMMLSFGVDYNFEFIAVIIASAAALLLSFSSVVIDQVNRLMFYAMLIAIGLIIFGLGMFVDWSAIPIIPEQLKFDDIRIALPVVFTSFGYQTIFPFLVNYCDQDPKQIRRACFFGSMIPAVIYGLWFAVIIAVLYNNDREFYESMINGTVDVGEMIARLSGIANSKYGQIIVWLLSILAIFTSLIGLGLGLVSAWESILARTNVLRSVAMKKIGAIALSFIPSLVIALLIPNAFIRMLSFAGVILVIIAILLPLYLLSRIRSVSLYYGILNFTTLRLIGFGFGVGIIVIEIVNLFYKGV